jgi:hypothetical protein
MQILHSSLTIFIMFAWRFLCALSIQDLILCSIFIDKLWVIFAKLKFIVLFLDDDDDDDK